MHSAFTRGVAVAVAMFAGQTAIAQDVTLPSAMIWTSYDLGSTGYVEASAVADALDKQYGTTIRLVPSGTGIGRMLPLTTGRASYGFMGNEILFASEGTFEFAERDWGPQDLRVLLGRPAAVGLVTGEDTDIMSPNDLKGRRVGFVQASPSTLMNTEAALAFAGLTPSDVEQVTYPGYGAMMSAFVAGDVEVVPVTTSVAALREAEGGRGVRWLDMPASDIEGWKRLQESSSLFSPYSATEGVAITEANPADLMGYRYPQLTTVAETGEEEVYNLMKAMDENYDLFKDASSVMPLWSVEEAGTTPAGAPFHPGAIRYLTEVGVWTDEDTAWNDARIAQIEEAKAAWADAMEKAEAEGVSDADWPEYWMAYRTEAGLD